MKILKPGRTFSPAWQMTCNECKCEFAFTNADTVADRDGLYIKCPNILCGKVLAPDKTIKYAGAATYRGTGPGAKD